MAVEEVQAGKLQEKVGLPNWREKKNMVSWNEKQHESLLAVSHEILPSIDFCLTKHVLALEVLSCRDLHYEHGLMKEELRGA